MVQILQLSLLAILAAAAATEGSAPAPVCANADDSSNCQDEEPEAQHQQCDLYLASSTDETGSWSVYTGRNYASKATVGATDLVLPITDANKNEYSPWHDMVWDADLLPNEKQAEHRHQLDHFWAGLGSLATCAQRPNLLVNKSTAAADDVVFQAKQTIKVGDELTMDCGDLSISNDAPFRGHSQPLDWLQANGVCLDTLSVKDSTVCEGRGAFSKHDVAQGDVVIVSPVVHFDRSQTEILEQERSLEDEPWLLRDHKIRYTSQVVGQQKLLNYCYSHPNSNVMLLPNAPGVNFINHSSEKPNVQIRWSSFCDSTKLREELPIMELFEQAAGDLVVEFVALTEIQPGK